MSLENHVDVSIQIASSALALPGFGTPLILASPGATPVGFTDRRRLYTSAAAMLADGWLASDEEYLMALAIFSQRPKPQKVMVGRRNTAVAQVNTILVTAGTDGTYTITLNGTAFVHVAAGQTAAQIAAALRALVAAGADVVGGLVTLGGVDPTITLTSAITGIPMVVSVSGPAITNTLTTPNHGIPEDLVLVTTADADWYCLLIPEQDRSHIVRAVAPTIEAQNRIAMMQSAQAAILSAAYNPGSITADIASELRGLGYQRTALWYHPTATQFLAAAITGRMLPEIPGSATWKFKSVATISAVSLTPTERANLESKNANSYEFVAGRSITFNGTMGEGEWIDIIIGVDKLYSRIQALIFGAQVRFGKIPYTQQGLRQIGNLVANALEESRREGFIANSRTLPNGEIESPAYSVSVPDISTIDAGTRETRQIPSNNPITFEGTLAGAIHKVNVTGVVSF